MSDLNDDALLKRAGHAGRNLTLLALLASVLTLVLVYLSFTTRAALPVTLVFAASLALISAGYWVLAVAARRGNPNSVGFILVLIVVQIALWLILSGVVSARHGTSFQPNTTGLVMPVLVFIAVYQSRKILLELQDRGLWERAFAGAKPSSSLCVAGAILLAVGFLALDSSMLYSGETIARKRTAEMHSAQAFARLIQADESEFMTTMDSLWRNTTPIEMQAALARLDALERRLGNIENPGPPDGPLSPVLANYRKALGQWKKALLVMQESNSEAERAHDLFKLGDRYRAEACEEFNRHYAPRAKFPTRSVNLTRS